ncbi:AMP-binding protein, partial [Xanthomonas sp. MUS 060]|uniref:AMP-binding protein n=1 Tax=Xanthomonas sp. MUS 060 TaxID=1588031 RepID=UPI0005F27F9E
MLEDSAPVAVLAQTSTSTLLLTASAPIINLDESHWQDRSVSNLSDPAYPVERLAYMLEDSAPVAVLAQTSTSTLLLTASAPIINLDESHWQDRSVSNLSMNGLTSAHLAYVIYTSGRLHGPAQGGDDRTSTGRPKGVMIEHRNTVNLPAGLGTAHVVELRPKVLFSTSLNFDLSVYECFVCAFGVR